MQDGNIAASSRVAAAKEFLERGYGRPGSYVHLETEKPLSELEPKEALALISNEATIGNISMEKATRLTNLIEARIKAIEIAELEERIRGLEAAA